MIFTSTIFLFIFLPAALLSYYTLLFLSGSKFRNLLLLCVSLLFYLYGAAEFILLLILSTAADYGIGRMIEHRQRFGRWWVGLSAAINLGLLLYFKYAGFIIGQTSPWLESMGIATAPDWESIALPIGISFFTFQKISYIVDVYRGQVRALRRPTDFALYVVMFPQLVAGPIVRFKDIRDQLCKRSETWHRFYMGSLRFCWGLFKKVLIADACGQIADAVFGMDMSVLDAKSAWFGAVAYTFQIYFDFSAYSDMAIGLARMFGFELHENFNRPYAAVGMTDFWRRWHISLSTWFRDYLYIPMGGNRKGPLRTALHLFIVFGLCGLWHGASWTFLIWGLYHGFFLALERTTRLRDLAADQWPGIRRTFTFLVAMIGWVVFRSDTLSDAIGFLKAMAVPVDHPIPYELFALLNYRTGLFMLMAAAAVIGAGHLPSFERIVACRGPLRTAISVFLILVVLPYCAAFIVSGTGNPFIYYRF